MTRTGQRPPLGAYSTWPQSLRLALSLVLNAKGIAALYWGAEQWLLYNDAYGSALGDRHPGAFGRSMPEVLTDIGPVLGPQVEEVIRTGVGFAIEDMSMVMRRHGRDEETAWTYSFSPVQGEDGGFAGVLLLATETTSQKRVGIRREALIQLGNIFRDLESPSDLVREATKVLGQALDARRVGYGTVHHDTETVHVEQEWDAPGQETLDRAIPLRHYGTYVDELKLGETNIIVDVHSDPRTDGAADELARLGATSFVNVPVLERGRLVALLFVNDDKARDWTPDDLDLIREFASRLRVAVERGRNAEALRSSEVRLRELNESLEEQVAQRTAERDQFWRLSRDPFLICDTAGRWISASPVWTEILGWSQDELLGRTSEWMEHPDDRDKTRSEIIDVSDGEVTTAFVNRFRDRNGEYRTFSWSAVSEDERLFCVARDITDEAKRAAALRLNENIVQSDTAPICAFDTEYRLIAFNQAHSDEFFRIYGYRVQVGDVFPDLFNAEQAPIMRGFMARALAGEVFTVTQEFGDPELVVPYWEVSYSPLRDGDGQIIGAFHHAVDITTRLRAESDLAITQEALRQSQKMESVGQLTGGLAHDFNNLLAGILGSLEMMQARIEQGRAAEIGRYMTGAQGAAKRAAALTHRLLAFSRRQTLEPKPTDVNRLVDGMEELIRRTVGPQVTVETTVAADLWSVLVDPPQLENALLNLAINARDAMPDGGRIVIKTANRSIDEKEARERDLTPGAYVSLSVSDNGSGMPKEVADRAFDPFFTTKPIGLGTGLGLSMIYGFARQSGGQVVIRSDVGRGTVVSIDLPPHHLEAVVDGPAEIEPITRADDARTVLVIDDEPLVRMLVVDAVEDLGYTALEAGDGPQGLKVLRSDVHLDLLITDVGLPNGMNGRQVADAARELRPGLKVMFITGYAANAVLGGGVLDPGMQVVTKPFDMNQLTRRVHGMMTD